VDQAQTPQRGDVTEFAVALCNISFFLFRFHSLYPSAYIVSNASHPKPFFYQIAWKDEATEENQIRINLVSKS
jgi:hypothetical protein